MYKCICWRSTGYERDMNGKSTGYERDMFPQHLPFLIPFVHGRLKRFTGYLQYISIVQR